jgi:ABC-type glutathione transport system ATPase component
MIIEVPIFFLLSLYLEAVFPSDFGVTKQWHYPITDTINHFKTYQKRKKLGQDYRSEAILAVQIEINEEELKNEDQDVKDERKRVFDSSFEYEKYPLVVKNMRKVYAGRGGAGPKLACKDVTLGIEKGVTFGLLGPNGAGKTSLISILTGLYEPSAGSATISGHDIKTETDKVYKRIGICPQVHYYLFSLIFNGKI